MKKDNFVKRCQIKYKIKDKKVLRSLSYLYVRYKEEIKDIQEARRSALRSLVKYLESLNWEV